MTQRSKTARTAWLSGLLVAAAVGVGTVGAAAAPPTDPTTPTTGGPATTVAPTDTTAPAVTDTTAPAAAPVAALPPGVELPPAPVLPSNVETVEWAAQEIPAVGSKSGEGTKLVQQRLLDLGFWNTGADGKYGFSTTQAVMAFQKYNNLKATGSVDKNTAFMLTFATERARGQTTAPGTVVEVDKGRQVLFIVQDGKTLWAYNTSTGSGIPYETPNKNDPTKIETGDAQTPNGLFITNRERPEGWWEGDLGKIYRPKYFNGGIAVHGMTSVPNYPASHGCVRVSTMAMDFIWDQNLIPLRTSVWVHD